MKSLVSFLLEYLRNLRSDGEFVIEIGNHGDLRKTRGQDSNFVINNKRISDNDIVRIINKFSKKINDKISNNTLVSGDFSKTIQLIDYDITVCISLKGMTDNYTKYVLSVKSVWSTKDDYGDYRSKYQSNKQNKNNRKIFIDDIKHF